MGELSSDSETERVGWHPRIQTTRPAILRDKTLCSFCTNLPDLPMALPLGELSSDSETERARMLGFAHGLALSVNA